MKRFEPLALSGDEAQALAEAYSDGSVTSEPLGNLLTRTNAGRNIASLGLHLLPVALPTPHFCFEGNRAYGMAGASNGETCGIFSWETSDDGQSPMVGVLRLEIIKRSPLPFMSVPAPPDDEKVLRAAVSFIGYCVDGWRNLPEGPDKAFGKKGVMPFLLTSPKAWMLRNSIFNGGEPDKVLSELIALSPSENHTPRMRMPRP